MLGQGGRPQPATVRRNPGAPLHPCLLRTALTIAVVSALLLGAPAVFAYSVLTHEAIIDAAWSSDIVPTLLARFPQATPEQLRQAHAYAYGGAIIQDVGYYPYGSRFVSDLAHYVRSGDFILALLQDSTDLNEYAFALGSLAHYAADHQGHRLATNVAVPLLYPDLRKKFGGVVTYEDSPLAHLKTEFGFDVLEVAKGRFPSDAYHDFIGFDVAQPLLNRAFQETYGLDLGSLLTDEELAIGSYRHAVSKSIPEATRVAWQLKKDEIRQDMPGITRKKFLHNISRADYEKNWGKDYRQPGLKEEFLAFLVRLLPKVGKLKALTLRMPTPPTEQMFERSFNATLDQYRSLLQQVRERRLTLPNDNFDVGAKTGPGQYPMADQTYAALLLHLARQGFVNTSPELRSDILRFFADPDANYATKKDARRWLTVKSELDLLQNNVGDVSRTGSGKGER